MHDMTI